MGWEFSIEQGGLTVAEGSGPDLDSVRREAFHYAMQYAQDGPLILRLSPTAMEGVE